MRGDDALLDADERARSRALDVTGSFIVQAPAGSGKTELLIQRYLALLSIVENPEDVLAITFTRKAALEMQLRVAAALRSAYAGEQPDTEHERLTLTLASDVLARDKTLGWQLIDAPARMRIETVDAFGAGIARSLPASSGLGGVTTTAADAAVVEIYQAAAAATLDYLADGAAGDVVERLLLHLDNNVAAYVAYLARMLGSREQWLGITGSGNISAATAGAVRKKLEANIADIVERELAVVDALLPAVCREQLPALLQYAAQNLCKDGQVDRRLVAFADDSNLPAPAATQRRKWCDMADLLLTQKGQWRKQVTKNEGFPPENKVQKQALKQLLEALGPNDRFCAALHRVRRLPEPYYRDDQWEVLLALFDLLPLAVAELHRLFGELGVTDHNEVAIAAGRALGSDDEPGDAALLLDHRVKHLLVDEMQDTSISQYELLRKVTAGWTSDDGRTIFCVGDPMQSIYRFRDAEVGEFLLARSRGIGSVALEPLTLRRNFRSGEHLVNWFNATFRKIMPDRDDIAVGAIAYSESVPIAEKVAQGDQHVHALFAADALAEAGHSLALIRDLLEQHADEDVAVLVRSRTTLTQLLPLLRRNGIEYRAVEIDRLTDLPELIDVLALTRAFCHEGDRLAWLALLRAPSTGLSWQDLHALVMSDRESTICELYRDQERLALLSDEGRQRLLSTMSVLQRFNGRNLVSSLRTRVERAWFALGGPALLQDGEQLENVYRFLDTLEKIGFAGTLDDVAQLERRLDDERVSSTVSTDCRLHVMTMHKAKGLQFDHVILHGLGRATRTSDKEVLNWLTLPDASGGSEMIISPVGPRAEVENDPLHQFIESVEKEKSACELDRLLYVACTRAKKSLHLVGSVELAADGTSFRTPDGRSLLARLWPALEDHYDAAFQADTARRNDKDTSDVALADAFAPPPLRRLDEPWQVPVLPDLPGLAAQAVAGGTAPEKAVEFYWVGAATRHAGTIVHRWLQRISDGENAPVEQHAGSQHSVSRRWAIALGVAEADLERVCSLVEQAVARTLNDEKGRWILYGDGATELAVTGIYGGRLESIVIDRVRIDEDGTHWIIDYKTSTHEGGDLAAFLGREAERYRPQLAKYAALYGNLSGRQTRTALYFPLLQQFCEVTV